MVTRARARARACATAISPVTCAMGARARAGDDEKVTRFESLRTRGAQCLFLPFIPTECVEKIEAAPNWIL